jgi:hypothetical protein
VRKILWTISGLWLCGLLLAVRADTFPLADGSSLAGDIIKFTESGITFRLTDETYTNVLWTKFSQDGLKQLAQNPKIKPLVEPFIEIPAAELPRKAEVQIQPVQRLDLPPKPSLIGGLFTSSAGLFVLFLIYAANLYAGFEVAVCRGKPIPVVMGVAAVLPVAGPIIFLSLPAPAAPVADETPVEATDQAGFTVPGNEQKPEEIHIVAASWQPGTTKTPPQIFQRGQFTFNRRFFETRFPGFFGSVRRDEDRDKELILRATKGEFIVERIASVATNDISFETLQGGAKQAVSLPFGDIQEIQLKTKDA